MERVAVWLVFVVAVLAFGWFRPNGARIFLGGFFIVMGIGFHLVLILNDPHGYDGFSASALLPPYRWAFRELVMPHPLAFAVAAAAFEIAVGLLMWGKRRRATAGLLLATVFLLGITPLGRETLPNALLALGTAHLATKTFPRSLWELALDRLHGHAPRGMA